VLKQKYGFCEDGRAVSTAAGRGAASGNRRGRRGDLQRRGGPLGDGALHGRVLVCPFHAWGFDCVTGLSDAGDNLRQATYPVKTESGEIFVDVP
jgi:hypothetical protein